MRLLGWTAFCLTVALASCSDPGPASAPGASIDRSAQLGCGEVAGLKALTDPGAPAYILVGEFIETNEAPAAFAELACQLAARQDKSAPVFVGLSEYVGGETEAETAMRTRLEDLVAKGAPMVVGSILDHHPTNARERTTAEQVWAHAIMDKVKAAGAARAVLLMPRTDALAVELKPSGERFAGYTPMALHLPEGKAVSLEIGASPTQGIDVPTVRLYTSVTDGFHGQVALGALTRTAVVVDMKATNAPRPGSFSINEARYLAESSLSHDQQVDVLMAYLKKIDDRNAAQYIRLTKEREDKGIRIALPPGVTEEQWQERLRLSRTRADTERMLAGLSKRPDGPRGQVPVHRSRVAPDFLELIEASPGYKPAESLIKPPQ